MESIGSSLAVRHGWASYSQARAAREIVLVIVGGLVLLGLAEQAPQISAWMAPAGIAAYVLFSVLIVWPFRMWRDLTARVAALDERKSKRVLLDEIADLRERVIALRIEMERDIAGQKSVKEWEQVYLDIEKEIADRIERFASHAESVNFRARGIH